MIRFLKEQTFLVTGASSGIGEGVALLLNELGASVIGIGRNQERLNALKRKCSHPENMLLEKKDLTDDIENLPRYVKSLVTEYGKLQGLAYCAGITNVEPLQMIALPHMQAVYDINVLAPIFMAKGVGDLRCNVGQGTSLVFISSYATSVCARGTTAYSSSKAALAAAVRVMAKELSGKGIRLNLVSPADVETPMTQQENKVYVDSRLDKYPLGLGKVEDVANITAFLLSDKTRWITGQDYILNGGVMS